MLHTIRIKQLPTEAVSPTGLTAGSAVAFLGNDAWRNDRAPEKPGFDSFLFGSELLPADGAAGDTGPQPSPLPPKPKLQQPIGDSALGGQQWTPVLVNIVLCIEPIKSFEHNLTGHLVLQRQPTHSKTLDTVCVCECVKFAMYN